MYIFAYSFNQPGWMITGASFTTLSYPNVLPYTIELYKEMSCDQKQIDFISNINKTFNLVVVEHPTKTKTLIIEPMVNYSIPHGEAVMLGIELINKIFNYLYLQFIIN